MNLSSKAWNFLLCILTFSSFLIFLSLTFLYHFRIILCSAPPNSKAHILVLLLSHTIDVSCDTCGSLYRSLTYLGSRVQYLLQEELEFGDMFLLIFKLIFKALFFPLPLTIFHNPDLSYPPSVFFFYQAGRKATFSSME